MEGRVKSPTRKPDVWGTPFHSSILRPGHPPWRPSEVEVPGLNCIPAVPHRFTRTKLSTRLTSITDIPLNQHTLMNQAREGCATQIPTNAYICSTRPFN